MRASEKREIDNVKLMSEKIFKDIKLNGIDAIRKLFSEGTNLTERLEFNPVKEYIKKIVISQLDVDKMLLSHKYFDKNWDLIPEFRMESDELNKNIYSQCELKFNEKTIDALFGNSLNIISDEEHEEWREFTYGIHNGIKFDDIYLEEEFKYKHENEKNVIKKFINSFHYRKLTKGNLLEDKYTKRVRQMLRKEISQNPENTFIANSNVNRMIEKGLAEYESIKEIEDISRMVLIPFITPKNSRAY